MKALHRLKKMQEQAGEACRRRPLLAEVLEELGAALTELSAVGEALSRHNDALTQSCRALEDERRRYRELFDFAPVGYLITSETGKIREANFTAARLLEADREYLQGKPLAAFVTQHYRATYRSAVMLLRRDCAVRRWELEAEIKTCQGSVIPVVMTVEPVIDNAGKVEFLRWLLLDQSVRRWAESALREKEIAERMRQERDLMARMMDTNPAGIAVVDSCGKIVYANSRVEQILGVRHDKLQVLFASEISGAGESPTYCPVEVFQKVSTERKPVYNYHGTISRPTRKTTHLSVSGAPIFKADGSVDQVVLTVNDETRYKKTNDEMLKADKLHSLGLLAGGIAHDFNNFMAVMLGNISLAKLRNRNQKIAENLEHMEKAVLQARDLTRKLFVFARGGAPVKTTVRLEKLLRDITGFALSGTAVIYEIQVAEGLLPVEADEAQVGQVISNVLINAVEAMPGGGKIQLAATNVPVDGAESALPLPDGEFVRIMVADEGKGIPAEQIGNIFDPFFSTKPKGSGLGLATAYTIVQNHGGLITAESEPGAGTTISIYLPASSLPCPEPPEDTEELHFGAGRILIMDDEELILKACGEMLTYLGYGVDYSRDGMEAVRLYREAVKAGSPYDALILDLTIPGGIGGKEAIELLLKLDPAVKAIVSSGYSNDPVVSYFKDYGFSGFVNKPYRIRDLSTALQNIFEKK